MPRSASTGRCAALALFIGWCAPIDASLAQQRAPVACPLEVVGTWRLATPTESQPSLLSFAPDGWVNVLGGPAQRPARHFEILAQVRYQFLPRRDPRRIEFHTRRGNDVFAPGASSWEITAYTDESFAARRSDSTHAEQSLWSRVQTHRYFLTFAARSGTAQGEPTRRDPAAFVMWTTLDGEKTEIEALGVYAQRAVPRFGRIPDALAKEFATQSKRRDHVMMRLELSEAEYRRTHEVFDSWDSLLRRNFLAGDEPHAQAMEVLDAAVQSANRCGLRIRLSDEHSTAMAGSMNELDMQQRPLELVKRIRKINDRWHLHDKAFPYRWKPPPIN